MCFLSCFSSFFTCFVKKAAGGTKTGLLFIDKMPVISKVLVCAVWLHTKFCICIFRFVFHRSPPSRHPPIRTPPSTSFFKMFLKAHQKAAVLRCRAQSCRKNHLADNPTGAATALRRIIIAVIRVMTPLLSNSVFTSKVTGKTLQPPVLCSFTLLSSLRRESVFLGTQRCVLNALDCCH